ncbi:MAG: T9SS type A sorting domain-containing protein [Bacteroidetes bacterium]|nr:T9SS type A sorting domain-containing protein [Bacteroidota bacterium]
MKGWLYVLVILCMTITGQAQNFELVDRQENYLAGFNQLVKIQLKIKNNTDKAQFYTVRKSRSDLGESQKGYFCLDSKCLESSITEFSKRVEAGETINLNFTVESGMQQASNNFKFEIFPKGSPSEAVEHLVSLSVDERALKSIYQSREITINDVYPNPAQDLAVIDYKIHNESLKAKIIVHNILGRSMSEYELPIDDTRIKMVVDDFAPGVYFYTLYVNNTGVLTRKIMVRK